MIEIRTTNPGLTLEYCCECDGVTGRAGRHDDSLYADDDNGPYCDECFIACQDELEAQEEAQ